MERRLCSTAGAGIFEVEPLCEPLGRLDPNFAVYTAGCEIAMGNEIETVRRGVARALPAFAWIIGTVVTLTAGCGGDEFSEQPDPGHDDAGDASQDVKSEGSAGAKADAEAGSIEAGDASDGSHPDGDADAGCGDGFKLCSGKCVAIDDPKTGCAAKSCDPCSLPHATASCGDAGTCELAQCDEGFEDCDKSSANGCEGNLQNDPKNCKTCGNECPATTGTPVCESGVCGVSNCNTGKGDCDKDKTNGCEVDTTSSVENCGFCGNSCDVPHASDKCADSACVVDQCDQGRGNCNGQQDDGCEVDLTSTVAHCGACDTPCTVGDHAQPSCVDSACKAACDGTFADCNKDPVDGCEIDTSTNVLHCSGCDKPCVVANATAACSNSTCIVGSCNTNWGDCNTNPADGCETNLQTTPAHCSSCGHACTAPANATATCVDGACGFACNGTWQDCDGDAANGCEVDLAANVSHCGTCTNVCSTANGTPGCMNGVCGILSCNPGYLDCNGTADTDCEIDGQTNVANCGQCGHFCTLEHAASQCVAGGCVFTCAAPFADCDVGPVDACNIDTGSSMDHCGGCGKKCDPPNAQTKSCVSGVCTIGLCASGFFNCDGQVANGCEINLTSDPANCGLCGNQCEYEHATPLCVSAQCSMGPCLGAWKNCDGQAGNGCEIDTNTSLAHCGGCGKVCAFANAAETCANGACSMGACDGGYTNCDGDTSNGCEAQLATDGKNCGSCGHDCLGGTCTNGKCNPVAIASGLNKPWSIAVDSTHVYWSTWVNPGVVQRIPIAGGPIQTLASGQLLPNGIAINSKNIYWANGAGQTVYMTAKDGSGTPKQIWSGGEAVAVSATEAIITFDTWTGGIYRGNADGTGVALIPSSSINTNPNRIATDGTHVWWANWGSDQVRRLPIVGGVAATDIATGQDGALNVIIDGTYVFWTAEYSKTVMRALQTGGSVTTMATGQNGPIGLAADSTYLYFASSGDGEVRRMVKAGVPQAYEILATGQSAPAFMAVDATSLYWANYGGGTVMRLRLP